MKVIYDLQAYTFGSYGGIVRMFNESISRFAAKDDFHALFYAPARLAGTPPAAPNIKMSAWRQLPGPLQPYALARALYKTADKLYWRLKGGDIFHPTFYPEHSDLFRLKSVVNVYDLTHEKIDKADDMPDHNKFKQIKRNALRQADRVICISEATRNDLYRFYDINPEIVRVVHLGYNPTFRIMDPDKVEQIIKPLLKNSEKPFFLYIGSRQAYKNFDCLLNAYTQWHLNNDISLLVIGGGVPPPNHAEMKNVTFLDQVNDDELCALYNKASFFAYPSLNEGFGIPMLEAMASNCPVCASDIPAFREVAGDTACYFDPYSFDSMISTFEKAMDQKNDAQLQHARRERITRFSWDQCAENIWHIYEELI